MSEKIVKQIRKTSGLTDEQICMIWELKDHGLNQREIQEKIQTTRYYVRKTLKGHRPIPPQRQVPHPRRLRVPGNS